ncbi:MAG: hypothetical protein HZA24_03780 [Nitrospirae bacterium]|nr:hypothetical protein [Nitrospirota bacterium]
MGATRKSTLKAGNLRSGAGNQPATASRTINPAPKKGKLDSKTIKRAVDQVISSRTGKKPA